jgi:hypothetical protein
MRFRVWGISLIQLWMTALLPVVFWILFRWHEQSEVSVLSVFRLYRPTLVWAIPVYFLFSLSWIYLVKRGLFTARYALYTVLVASLAFELVSAVGDRSFGRIGLGLIFLLTMVMVYRWLNGKIESAQINPRIEWFEGEPKTLPNLKARIKIQEEWFEATVRSMDQKGVFIFLSQWGKDLKSFRPRTRVEFEFEFRDKRVEGEGKMTSFFVASQQKPGIGLQFLPKDLYHFSQYTALVESLKGEGYV